MIIKFQKAYNIIAFNFDELLEPEKALYYYKKSLIYAENSNNLELQNWIYNNIGNIYCFDKKRYEKGISYYIKSLYFSRATKDSSQIFLLNLILHGHILILEVSLMVIPI